MSKSKLAGRYILAGFIVSLVLFGAASSIHLLKELVSPVWVPVALTFTVAVVLSLPLMRFWKWLLGIQNVPLRIICNTVALWAILLSSSLIVNKCTPGGDVTQTEVTVNRLYLETRYHTKRATRRVYTRGAPYTVFRVEVKLPGEAIRCFDIKKKKYDLLSKGDTALVETRRGALGMTSINPATIHLKDSALEKSRDKKKLKRKPELKNGIYTRE